MEPQAGTPQQDLVIGLTIGSYLVTQKLGEGGMGAVYLGEHPLIGKKVALKVLHPEFSSNAEVARRFFDEAKSVNSIGHPNIVDIVDYGVLQTQNSREQLVYFIMEYLQGQTLSQIIRAEAPLPPERALGIALQVGDALSASHKCGIVHRDLKPDNIMLQQRGRERDFVKLLDFGIAKLTGDAKGSHRTRTGIVMGTPAYMSPEQCDGRGMVDHRTDVYALGIVLYEMLIGRVPFQGEGYGEILVQHLTQPPVPLSQYRMMNPHVEAVVMKALQKSPNLRFPTMDEMMRAMSDPVGYVESQGGVIGFDQRQLLPSNGPMPAVKIPTPSPLTPNPLIPGGTPLPGTLTPGMMQGHSIPVTPTPTTNTSEGTGGKSKLPFIIAALVVVIGAAIAIAVVVGGGGGDKDKDKDKQAVSTPSGSDTAGESGKAGTGSVELKGSDKTVEKGSDKGSSAVGAGTGSALVTNGSGSAEVGSGSGSGSAVPTTVSIHLTTNPTGARIFVDDKELAQKTPLPFDLPKGKKAHIKLKLSGFDDLEMDLTGDENVEKTLTLKQHHVQTPVIPQHTGSQTTKVDPGKGSQTTKVDPGKGSQTTKVDPGKGSQTTPGKGSGKTGTELIRPD